MVVEEPKLLPLVTKLGIGEESLKEPRWRGHQPRVLEEESAQVTDDGQAADIDDAPVVKFIQKMLLDAINDGASDIHFEPYEKFYRIRFRVDGTLREVASRRW